MACKNVYIIIPAMDEADYLPRTLHCAMQECVDAKLHILVCVNQPDEWWQQPQKRAVCEANINTIEYIRDNFDNAVRVLDYASPSCGWKGKKHGVGQARRILMQSVLSEAHPDDIIISMDADTYWQQGYIQQVLHLLQGKAKALCAPYYHQLVGIETQDRAMLRYEIYMRTYLINMLRIMSPYAFTALGSVIACTASVAKAVDGFDTQTSGEDFYFLQKIAKSKPIALYTSSVLYPANRVSHRVPFGTGPAINKNMQQQYDTYPVFSPQYFDNIQQVYQLLPQLYTHDFDCDYLQFLSQIFKNKNFLQPLRNNSKTHSQFIKAFHQKADALREFQYLRYCNTKNNITDEENIKKMLTQYFDFKENNNLLSFHNMATMPLQQMLVLRDELYSIEMKLRKKHDIENNYI